MAAPPVVIAPSILAADFTRLEESVGRVAGSVPWLHLDVMDGHFVPNISFGPGLIKQLRQRSDRFFDCHLMIQDPGRYLDRFVEAGCDLISFHVETQERDEAVDTLLERIHQAGRKAGLAVSPPTDVERLVPFVDRLDLALIMTVHPGFGGQSFMAEMMPKIERLRSLRPDLDIEVDGGVGPDTIATARRAGANVFVAGTSVFKAPDPAERARELRRLAESAA